MQTHCTCKKEITGWYFNFSEDDAKFDRNDAIGERLLKTLRKMNAVTHTTESVAQALNKIETDDGIRKWFLREIKKHAHKSCYGWQCRLKIVKPNKRCKMHNKK